MNGCCLSEETSMGFGMTCRTLTKNERPTLGPTEKRPLPLWFSLLKQEPISNFLRQGKAGANWILTECMNREKKKELFKVA